VVVALPLLNGSGTGGHLLGNLLILIGAVSWAAYPVIAKRVQASYTPLVLTTAMMIPAMIISGLFSLGEIITQGFVVISLTAWAIIIYSAVITIIYYLLVHRLIQQVSSVMGTIVLYLQPISAFLWAAPLLGEKLTSGLVLGAGLTIWGAYLVTKTKG
jgi:drug/metabolite transporter (DMT)-like permease